MRNYFKRGQALLELALFSSIIIFAFSILISYGMNFSHNQRVAMMAFKQAQAEATNASATYMNASVVLIYDKAIAEPGNIFGTARRAPLVISSSAMRSNWLFSETTGADEEIPRVVYIINGKRYVFKTAAVENKGGAGGTTKQYIDHWNGQGLAWAETAATNNSADVDGDGKDETIISGGLVLDYQDGQIDTTEDNPDKRQGLLPDTKTKIVTDASIQNIQQGRRLASRTRVNNLEIIERKIRLNPNADLGDLPDQISNNNAGASDYAKDEIIDEGGERFLIVRSAFSTADNENRYLWNVSQ